MMAYRIAYCKVNYPLAYYAAYFSIRASAFSYELMCQGKKNWSFISGDYKNRSDSLSKKDQDTLKDMRIVQRCMREVMNSFRLIFTGRRRQNFESSTAN